MKKELICVYLADFIMGGIESYYIRMFEWGQKQGYDLSLVILYGNNIHQNWISDLKKYNVNIAYYKVGIINNYIIDSIGKKRTFETNKEYQVIVTDIHAYLKMQLIREREELKKMSVLLYSFTPTNGVGSVKRWLNQPFQPFFDRMSKSALVMMDEECKLYCEQYNNITIKDNFIKRLGIRIPDYNEEYTRKRIKSRREGFTILSISRMDFPFKGYVLGLLDTYEELKTIYPMLKLIIVGDGPDRKSVHDKMFKMEEKFQKDIKWINELSYEELNSILQEAHLYIGMGTTLLDSALTNLISVVATANQYGDTTPGLFIDNINNVSGNINISSKREGYFKDYIRKVIGLSDEEYYALSKKTYDMVKNEYNIEIVMSQIMKQYSFLSFQEAKFKVLRIYTNLFAAHKYWKKDRKNDKK